MRLPIQYALLHPERVASGLTPWNPLQSPPLTFEEVDHKTFPSIRLARAAFQAGGTAPCVLNAANEEAVGAFLRGECPFLGISECLEAVMSRHLPVPVTLETVTETDAWARSAVKQLLSRPK
jgi:1-deoxy-D-xylulose-5-phosphate reductoisomerase